MDRISKTQRIDISGRCTVCLSQNGDMMLSFDGRSIDLPNLSNYEKARIGHTFLDAASPKTEEEVYRAAKADESGYRAFLDGVADNEEYAAWVEHIHTPKASEC